MIMPAMTIKEMLDRACPRNCAHCGLPLVRGASEPRREFEARRYCNRMCYNAIRRVASSRASFRRTCRHCGARLHKRPREGASLYATRQYCDRDCYLDHRRQPAEAEVGPDESAPFRAYCEREYAEFPSMIRVMTRYLHTAHEQGRLSVPIARAMHLEPASYTCPACGMLARTAAEAESCCRPGGLGYVGEPADAGGEEGGL